MKCANLKSGITGANENGVIAVTVMRLSLCKAFGDVSAKAILACTFANFATVTM